MRSAFQPDQLAIQTQREQKPVDWQTQLSRAKRGHNLSQVQYQTNPPIQRQVSISQGKLSLQRSVVDEERKKDREVN